MKLALLDKLQLKRIEKKISQKKKYLEKHDKKLNIGEWYSIRIVFFSSKFWFHENVKKFLESKGYKVVRIVLNTKRVVISWK